MAAETCDLPTPDPSWQPPAGTVDAAPAIPGETHSRLAFTPAALTLLDKLWALHGPLMFHQSGGCCDGSAPMCYPAGEFRTGEADILLGVLTLPTPAAATGADAAVAAAGGDAADPRTIEFWMSREQFQVWQHTHLTVDVVRGRGSGFSLESPEGVRFLIRSRLL